MKQLLSLIVIITSIISAHGRNIFFETAMHAPIPEVKCTVYTSNMDSVASCISNEKGEINISDSQVHTIRVYHPDYNERLISLSQLSSDTIRLTSSTNLKEIIVTPNDVEEFTTHTSYRISAKDMERYANVLQSLNEIPNLTVLSSGGIFFEGNSNMKLLIDGVEATTSEIQSLSKEDIAKIDVYQNPPPRFLAQGVASVIDIRLKSKIYGGNASVELKQSFYTLKGNNSAAFYYNNKNSRFSFLYDNENVNYRKYSQSEKLSYNFKDTLYEKVKDGNDSKTNYDNNNFNLSYQLNVAKNFLYNIKAGIGFNSDRQSLKQNVRTQSEAFPATNIFHTRFTKYRVGNYLEKILRNGATIIGNINYIHYNTEYDSRYQELGGMSAELQDSHSQYKTSLNGVFSEIQYQFPQTTLGYFYISGYESYKRSKYINNSFSFFQETNVTGASAYWMGWKGAWSWYAKLGVDWFRTYSITVVKPHNLVMPSPLIILTWRPISKIQVVGQYSYYGSVPSIAQLSETNQWLDTKLVYHGNSTLKPYSTHNASLRLVYNNKHINLSFSEGFSSSPNMICDMYTVTDDYMLQTLVNLDKYRMLSSQLDFTVKPLGNNLLSFWNRLIFAKLKGSNTEYSWSGCRFQWMTDLSLNLKHWTIDLFYQYPGKIVEGQLERPRAQCWSATLLYRPHSNLSVGLEWFMPFGRGFKESEHTVNSAPVYVDTEINIKDRANMLSVIFSYNFNFGRNKNHTQPQYDNISNDSGILRK